MSPIRSRSDLRYSGFAEQRKIKVLSEELFYNAQSQGFRVLLIDRPFVGGTEVWHSLPMMLVPSLCDGSIVVY